MVRLRDKRSGVIVQVDEAMAERLGSAYERIAAPSPQLDAATKSEPPAPRVVRAKK